MKVRTTMNLSEKPSKHTPQRSHLWRLWPSPNCKSKQSPDILLFSIYVTFSCKKRVCQHSKQKYATTKQQNIFQFLLFTGQKRTWRTSESTSTSNSLAASTKYATSLHRAATVDDFDSSKSQLWQFRSNKFTRIWRLRAAHPILSTANTAWPSLTTLPCYLSMPRGVVPCFRQSHGWMETIRWRVWGGRHYSGIETHTDPSWTSKSSIRRSGNNWCSAL